MRGPRRRHLREALQDGFIYQIAGLLRPRTFHGTNPWVQKQYYDIYKVRI